MADRPSPKTEEERLEELHSALNNLRHNEDFKVFMVEVRRERDAQAVDILENGLHYAEQMKDSILHWVSVLDWVLNMHKRLRDHFNTSDAKREPFRAKGGD